MNGVSPPLPMDCGPEPETIGMWAAEVDARDSWLMAAEAASDRQERAAEWDEWVATGVRS